MNYFDFYGIKPTFTPNQTLVKQKYYELSKAYHPDFFVNQSEQKQQEILELSTLNNKAYQTLSKPDKLTEYMLQLKGEISESEKYTLAQSFLLEMMDVNEALMELEFDANTEAILAITTQINTIEENLFEQQKVLFGAYEATNESLVLKQIKDIYYRKKYLLRIRESINKFATRI
ncbi:MAG: Fe-S protein assembly co-chaperone HscB [Sphingobacteriales bacterium]|nr:MAG: Fe-S protein assembly co-chaperone HscB [Sphingobacteriales bacterium]TAF81622.1 MAG: Fe-S protein assembly co-chaperone HscB [Sphingobacteriales bacterium]